MSRRAKLAQSADKHALYEASVQAPEVDLRFFQRVFKASFKRRPCRLREDFCGTAFTSATWVKAHAQHEAIGVDLDADTLAYGWARHGAPLSDEAQSRLQLVNADVLQHDSPPVDIVVAQNFSYCVLKTRKALKRYFKRARKALSEGGVFILDLFGGYESIEDDREDVRELDGFDYVWEQHRYDPISAFGTYKIHFRFPDQSELTDAFVYDWRLWTLPEVQEVLWEVGFDEVSVYWEGVDPVTGEGNGRFRKRSQGSCDPAWNAYIVGVRRL